MWKKGQALVPDVDRVRRRRADGEALRRARRLRLHRPGRGGPRLDRPPRAPEAGLAARLLLRQPDGTGDDGAARAEAAGRGEPRRDRRRRDQHVPDRQRPRRQRDRRQARQVRAVRQARRRHRQRARGHGARRADRRRWRCSCSPRRRATTPIGELDGFPVFAKNGRYGPVRPVGHARQPAARAGEAEDGQPVQDDEPRADHRRRRRGAAAAAAHARHRPGRRRGDHGQQRPLRAVRAEGQGLPQHRPARSSC